jgi:ATP-dependent Zn protease
VPLTPEERVKVRAHIAIHEAAHAVAALEQGIELKAISMIGPGESQFFTSFGAPASELMRQRPDDMGPVQLAGSSAEMYFFNGAHVTEGYAIDLQIIMAAYHGPPPDQESAQRFLMPWVERARAIVRERRAAIETAAVELMTADGLTRDEIVALVARSEVSPSHLPAGVLPESEDSTGDSTA